MSIEAVWGQQSVWSQAADRLKRSIGRARILVLALGVVAAATATASSQTMGADPLLGKVLAFAAAAAAGATPFAAQHAGSQRVRDWTRLRAVSEAFKCETYTYLAEVGAYRPKPSEAALAERIGRLRADSADLLRHTVALSARDRELPPVSDADTYVERRLRAQIDGYYRPRAELMARRTAAVRRAEIALGVLGAVLAAAAGAFALDWAGGWVAVGASVTLAVTAHGAAAKYDYQQLEFSRTSVELERLHAQWSTGSVRTTEAIDAFVSRCEDIISVQNDAWMVKVAEE
ncbi:DUF4231 domain-containing protein [Kitasatospora sp. GP82]|uniref:DUF4231 domain-containing protein n=1 Tax=Kitasatospora sp. GP82 TaxID=3035089 RepID=UPI0024768DC4|nr:DUF4231 domain-containing protein [Kitasatospora sp. GP82]MDH6127087.1 hypothetical protein [Kitasatospora sp. GP82]